MNEHLSVLERVGKVLFVMGLLDTLYLLYCIATRTSYVGVSIFAIIAGHYLLRQSLTAARVIAWFAAVFFYGILGNLIATPLTQPLDLLITQIRLDKSGIALSVVWGIIELGICYWVYVQLRSEPVLKARAKKGLTIAPPKLAFGLGLIAPICLAAIIFFPLRGESALKARQLAQQQHGSQYKYYVSGLQWTSDQVTASVIAYNDQEIKVVRVQWDK